MRSSALRASIRGTCPICAADMAHRPLPRASGLRVSDGHAHRPLARLWQWLRAMVNLVAGLAGFPPTPMPPHLVFSMLHRFRHPRRLEDGCSPYWEQVLGRSARAFRDGFVAQGLLREATDVENLAATHSVPQLKALAQARGLPVSGRKDALAARILAAPEAPPAMAERWYTLTEAGRSRYDREGAARAAAREVAWAEVAQQVTAGNLREALRRVEAYASASSVDALLPPLTPGSHHPRRRPPEGRRVGAGQRASAAAAAPRRHAGALPHGYGAGAAGVPGRPRRAAAEDSQRLRRVGSVQDVGDRSHIAP